LQVPFKIPAIEAFPHQLHGRDAAHHRGFEQQGRALGLRQPRQLQPVFGDQRLVGGDDRLAGVEGGLDRRLGRSIGPADQLHEDIDVGMNSQSDWVVEPAKGRNIGGARPRAGAGADADDLGAATAWRKIGLAL
jgi:hypothetical protein